MLLASAAGAAMAGIVARIGRKRFRTGVAPAERPAFLQTCPVRPATRGGSNRRRLVLPGGPFVGEAFDVSRDLVE